MQCLFCFVCLFVLFCFVCLFSFLLYFGGRWLPLVAVHEQYRCAHAHIRTCPYDNYIETAIDLNITYANTVSVCV